MSLTYKSLHWGTDPVRTDEMKVFVGRATPIGEIDAISYVTRKGDEAAVYRHDCESHEGRGPYLLAADPRGEYEIEDPGSDLLAIGRGVDVELIDKRRILLAGLVIVTDKRGNIVCLASRRGVPYGIEQRGAGPYVTPHGIEA